ncbi:MAG: lipocalin-like domain-containing protein [Acidobacteriota bacterium]
MTVGAMDWQQAQPGYSWSFPQDHWAHPEYRIEWWYFTGHLRLVGQERPRFGYQFTFYRVGLLTEAPPFESDWSSRSLIMGHAAITDFETGEHRFSELLYRTVPMLGGFEAAPGPRIAWSRAPAGTDGAWELLWNGEAFDFRALDQRQGLAFDLSTRPRKPLIFQGPGGFSRKGTGAKSSSYYYSFTRLETRGTLSWQGQDFEVEGQSWMDHEFSSSQLAENQAGWDWFSLQLEDGREVMLYQLRDRSGAPDFGRGTLVSPSGETAFMGLTDWTIQAERHWESPASGDRYPVQWTLQIPAQELRLQIVALLDDQENRSRLLPDLDYWEGAVKVLDEQGIPLGRGFVEMTGYGKNSRPPF